MVIADELDALRVRVPGCNALVLADLETGMPLCARTLARLPQEQIDLLSGTATHLLADELAALTSAPTRLAFVIEGEAVELFVRSADTGTEALCCNLVGGADLNVVAGDMYRLLARIATLP